MPDYAPWCESKSEITAYPYNTMSEKKDYRLTLGRGKLPIRLIKKNKFETNQQPLPSNRQFDGLFPVERRPEDLIPPRKKQGFFINFWNVGQKVVESGFADLPFSIVKGFDIDPPSVYVEAHKLTLADYDSLADLLFTVPVEDWDTEYAKLEYETADNLGLSVGFTDQMITDFYSVRLNPVNPDWKMTGLKGKGQLSVAGGGVTGFDLTDPATTKVTLTRNRNADAVSDFRITADAKVFMIPALHYRTGQGASGGQNDAISAGYCVVPHSMFLQLKQYYEFGGSVYHWPFMLPTSGTTVFTSDDLSYVKPFSGTYSDDINTAFFSAIRNNFISSPDKIRRRSTGPSTVVELPVSGFPTGSGLAYMNYQEMSTLYHDFTERILTAVIKMSGQTYYVWTTLDTARALTFEFHYNF